MYIIYCPDCGYYTTITYNQTKQMCRKVKKKILRGLPDKILCGNCLNHGDFTYRKIVRGI